MVIPKHVTHESKRNDVQMETLEIKWKSINTNMFGQLLPHLLLHKP